MFTPRLFRVFVCSTFEDFKQERDALTHVFDDLRRFCSENGCQFQAIDLRWGISREAAEDQRVVQVCLDEIRRCQQASPRPSFIALLGHRYGWRPLPTEIEREEFEWIRNNVLSESPQQASLLEEWYELDENAVPPVYYLRPRKGDSWAKDVEVPLRSTFLNALDSLEASESQRAKYERSLTEQEIRAGLFDASGINGSGFVYWKECSAFNTADAELDAPDEKDKFSLQRLKKDLTQNFGIKENRRFQAQFVDGQARLTESELKRLCDQVRSDLETVIREEITKLPLPGDASADVAEHWEFARVRSSHRNFRLRPEFDAQIASYLVSNGSKYPLLVTGPDGSGKTWAMARTAMESSKTQDAKLLLRFVTLTPASSDVVPFLQGLCLELDDEQSQGRVPNEYSAVVTEFHHRLTAAAEKRKVILFLDAIDQLSGVVIPGTFDWLPVELPSDVWIVATIRDPGLSPVNVRRVVEADRCISGSQLMPRQAFVSIGSFNIDSPEELLQSWLDDGLHPRTVTQQQLDRLVRIYTFCPRPLFLKLLAEEARCWRSGDESPPLPDPTQNEDSLLDDLYEQMLTRLSDNRNHGRSLVERALGHLAASRTGLSEAELIDVLSSDTEFIRNFEAESVQPLPAGSRALPVVVWARLFADLRPYLTSRIGDNATYLDFFHGSLKDVVIRRSVDAGIQRDCHRVLAEFFNLRWQSKDVHALRDVAYHYFMAGDRKNLNALARDYEFLSLQHQVRSQLPMETIQLARNAAIDANEAGGAVEFILQPTRLNTVFDAATGLLSPHQTFLQEGSVRAWQMFDGMQPHIALRFHVLLAWRLAHEGHIRDARQTLDRCRELPVSRIISVPTRWPRAASGDETVLPRSPEVEWIALMLSDLVDVIADEVCSFQRHFLDDATRVLLATRCIERGSASFAQRLVPDMSNLPDAIILRSIIEVSGKQLLESIQGDLAALSLSERCHVMTSLARYADRNQIDDWLEQLANTEATPDVLLACFARQLELNVSEDEVEQTASLLFDTVLGGKGSTLGPAHRTKLLGMVETIADRHDWPYAESIVKRFPAGLDRDFATARLLEAKARASGTLDATQLPVFLRTVLELKSELAQADAFCRLSSWVADRDCAIALVELGTMLFESALWRRPDDDTDVSWYDFEFAVAQESVSRLTKLGEVRAALSIALRTRKLEHDAIRSAHSPQAQTTAARLQGQYFGLLREIAGEVTDSDLLPVVIHALRFDDHRTWCSSIAVRQALDCERRAEAYEIAEQSLFASVRGTREVPVVPSPKTRFIQNRYVPRHGRLALLLLNAANLSESSGKQTLLTKLKSRLPYLGVATTLVPRRKSDSWMVASVFLFVFCLAVMFVRSVSHGEGLSAIGIGAIAAFSGVICYRLRSFFFLHWNLLAYSRLFSWAGKMHAEYQGVTGARDFPATDSELVNYRDINEPDEQHVQSRSVPNFDDVEPVDEEYLKRSSILWAAIAASTNSYSPASSYFVQQLARREDYLRVGNYVSSEFGVRAIDSLRPHAPHNLINNALFTVSGSLARNRMPAEAFGVIQNFLSEDAPTDWFTRARIQCAYYRALDFDAVGVVHALTHEIRKYHGTDDMYTLPNESNIEAAPERMVRKVVHQLEEHGHTRQALWLRRNQKCAALFERHAIDRQKESRWEKMLPPVVIAMPGRKPGESGFELGEWANAVHVLRRYDPDKSIDREEFVVAAIYLLVKSAETDNEEQQPLYEFTRESLLSKVTEATREDFTDPPRPGVTDDVPTWFLADSYWDARGDCRLAELLAYGAKLLWNVGDVDACVRLTFLISHFSTRCVVFNHAMESITDARTLSGLLSLAEACPREHGENRAAFVVAADKILPESDFIALVKQLAQRWIRSSADLTSLCLGLSWTRYCQVPKQMEEAITSLVFGLEKAKQIEQFVADTDLEERPELTEFSTVPERLAVISVVSSAIESGKCPSQWIQHAIDANETERFESLPIHGQLSTKRMMSRVFASAGRPQRALDILDELANQDRPTLADQTKQFEDQLLRANCRLQQCGNSQHVEKGNNGAEHQLVLAAEEFWSVCDRAGWNNKSQRSLMSRSACGMARLLVTVGLITEVGSVLDGAPSTDTREDGLFLIALYHQRHGETDKAIECCRSILAVNPYHILARCKCIESFVLAGQKDKAIELATINSMIRCSKNERRVLVLTRRVAFASKGDLGSSDIDEFDDSNQCSDQEQLAYDFSGLEKIVSQIRNTADRNLLEREMKRVRATVPDIDHLREISDDTKNKLRQLVVKFTKKHALRKTVLSDMQLSH